MLSGKEFIDEIQEMVQRKHGVLRRETRFLSIPLLIDVGTSSRGTLKEFSDRITTIKQLTDDEAQEIFVKF